MVKYLLLFSGGGMPESEAEQRAVMNEWMNWYQANGNAVVDQGSPFTPAAKSIASDGKISDGVASMASGYTIIQANSLDEAVKIAKSCPVLKGGAKISVFESLPMM